ncbi:Hypothetical predicted protein [Cloeon dipterum]|uniref:C-type lectin domain-containing protein n=1 Tax=Cloeon dipterum TaxID=197152 RepID=A0A8S1CEK0_9INSE|nr:Hypothetical predicted protein [Cloeon dipterum]
MTGIPTDIVWEVGQPDNKGGREDCIHLKVKNNTERTVITDRNCTDKYILACRGKPALNSYCSKPSCPNQVCAVENETRWKADHPIANGTCVFANFNSSHANYTDLGTANCTEKKKFVCEMRQKNTGRDALQSECAILWNVSATEIALFKLGLAGTASYSYRLKCFIRCVGINVGMFADNALVTDELLRKLEIISNDDPPTLQSGFDAFDICSPLRYDDECLTASNIYTCGLQNAPILTTGMVDDGKNNMTIYGPPVPCTPRENACYVNDDVPCVVDVNPTMRYATNAGKVYGISQDLYSPSIIDITYPNAFTNCCSVGMRLAHPMSVAEITFISNYVTTSPSSVTLVGELLKINSTHNAWCETGEPVPDDLYDTTNNINVDPDNRNYKPDCFDRNRRDESKSAKKMCWKPGEN